MGYSNGQLETLSATGKREKGNPGLPGIGFNLTDDGNFCNCKILEVACYSNLNNYRGSAVRDIRTQLGRFKLI